MYNNIIHQKNLRQSLISHSCLIKILDRTDIRIEKKNRKRERERERERENGERERKIDKVLVIWHQNKLLLQNILKTRDLSEQQLINMIIIFVYIPF